MRPPTRPDASSSTKSVIPADCNLLAAVMPDKPPPKTSTVVRSKVKRVNLYQLIHVYQNANTQTLRHQYPACILKEHVRTEEALVTDCVK